MEIRPKNQASPIDAYVNQVQSKQKADAVEENAARQQGAKADTVVISDAARRIQEAQAELRSLPDVRSDKVAELKNRIENGTYEIKPEAVADKMIRESLLNDLFK
jgi:negative regulator of flagellin synthesis FlgM